MPQASLHHISASPRASQALFALHECIGFHALGAISCNMLAERVGKNIREARKARGWSLEQLAAAVEPKSTHQHISRLERGSASLDLGWLEKVGAALNVDPVELVTGPRRERAPREELRLSAQVADEVARVLGTVARDGEEPSFGTVQVLALMLQELTVTFARHPEAMQNPAVVRPVTDSLSRQLARA